MSGIENQILQDIYRASSEGGFLTMRDLELNTSFTEWKLRPHLEDLKEASLIVEHPEGFQVAPKGRHFYKSNWG
ncbi:hypothetical protein CH352_10085 [Leptospira hartskeerlii]|uniref:Uncharacterized protein n=1 Tax=Leptospira hartskeerlii TaxID=2023177 RepID=A0A2M9XBD0_9LEPT|nr:hypothetical protein [Leptospira hartskeerlii]PJZ24919.1 hypothetical protein CH357_11890 [Leptospira hartskeerlii]PJZ33311.1 hypothetical protein CH352_10085 [Leptospira hartskeerlii]